LAYKVEIHRAAQKQILSLSTRVRPPLVQAIDQLAGTPRPSGCKKLHGTGLWRFRLGRYRVVYTIDDEAGLVTVIKVALRREDTYR